MPPTTHTTERHTICSEYGLLMREPHGVPFHCRGWRPQMLRPSEDVVHKTTTKHILHVDYIAQYPEVSWTTFILDKSVICQPGDEKLNYSIRTNVWAILGAQAQTRARILGSGTAFGTQKQFQANIEDAISSPFDISHQPSSATKTSYNTLAPRWTSCLE